ncbi:MAG: hypothetical protein EBU46_11590 [Nitrosomonadaceae bacterium]|nr:hypothetical protein [Nitrosomonadaceae bacterium]
MPRFSKVKKPKVVEPRFRPNTKLYALQLMASWSGNHNRAIRRCEEDADQILELLTTELPSGTFDKVVSGVLERLSRDAFYNDSVRNRAYELFRAHSDPLNRSF